VSAWLGRCSPWRREPLAVGIFEELIEAQGFVFEDTDKDDGPEGYVLRRRGKGQWAVRIYVHAASGAEIELKRAFWQGELHEACTVNSRNAGGRAALVKLAGEFSPYLTERIAQAEKECAQTDRLVRVLVLDFDINVTSEWLEIDARPREPLCTGHVERVLWRWLWCAKRLTGDE